MKRILIALLLVGSSTALFAQNTNTNNTTNNSSTTTDNNTTTTETTTDKATTTDNTNLNTTTNEVNATNSTTTDPNTSNNVNTSTNVNTTNPNTTNANTTMDNAATTSVSTGSYPAYGTVAVDVPTTVRYSFQKDHPMVTSAQWYMTPNGQYRVIYKDNMNQDMDVYYYGTSAQSYMVSLPVRQSLTPDDVVTKAKSMFGLSVYDINRVKAANNEDVYHVRLLDNGQVRSVWISEQGSEVAAADVFRTADVAENDIINEVNTTTTSDANAAMSSDARATDTDAKSTDTKIKIKSDNGTKIKAKTDK